MGCHHDGAAHRLAGSRSPPCPWPVSVAGAMPLSWMDEQLPRLRWRARALGARGWRWPRWGPDGRGVLSADMGRAAGRVFCWGARGVKDTRSLLGMSLADAVPAILFVLNFGVLQFILAAWKAALLGC